MLNKNHFKTIILSALVATAALKGNAQNQSEKDTVDKPKSQWKITDTKLTISCILQESTFLFADRLSGLGVETLHYTKKGDSRFATAVGGYFEDKSKPTNFERSTVNQGQIISSFDGEKHISIGLKFGEIFTADPITVGVLGKIGYLNMNAKEGYSIYEPENPWANAVETKRSRATRHNLEVGAEVIAEMNIVKFKLSGNETHAGIHARGGFTYAQNKIVQNYAIGLYLIIKNK